MMLLYYTEMIGVLRFVAIVPVIMQINSMT